MLSTGIIVGWLELVVLFSVFTVAGSLGKVLLKTRLVFVDVCEPELEFELEPAFVLELVFALELELELELEFEFEFDVLDEIPVIEEVELLDVVEEPLEVF